MAPRKQQTRPKKGKPIEIPVPKREGFERVVKRAAARPGEIADLRELLEESDELIEQLHLAMDDG